jgi:excisionase family DNA binding protein
MGIHLKGREKQDVFPEASMDGLTASLKMNSHPYPHLRARYGKLIHYTCCIVFSRMAPMKPASNTKERVEKPLTVRPTLSRAAAQFVDKHPNEVSAIVAIALEDAAREASLVLNKERVLPDALRKLIVARDSEEGRVLSISEAAERLEVTRVTIYAWIESKRLLAWRATRRGVLIPAEQILGPGEVVRGIPEVIAVIPDPEAAWDFLDEESAFIDPDNLVRPIEALREGKVDAVIAAAHSFLEAFS